MSGTSSALVIPAALRCMRRRAPRRAYMSRLPVPVARVIPRRSLQKLEAIYVIQQHARRIDLVAEAAGVTIADFEGIPDSSQQTLNDWLEAVRAEFDIYEEA